MITGALIVNIYMRAPDYTPTDKTINRLNKESTPKSKEEVVPLDIDAETFLNMILNPKEIRKEIKKSKSKLRSLENEKNVNVLKSVLSEYLSTFIIMGYDVNGNRIVIKDAETNKDEDSIIELIRYVMMGIIGGD